MNLIEDSSRCWSSLDVPRRMESKETHMGREKTKDLKFEVRKEKKMSKEKRKKDELNKNAFLTVASEDKMGDQKQQPEVQVHELNRKSVEGSKKKKDRKREEEGAGVLKSNLVSGQEPANDREKSNWGIKGDVDFADNEKKRKKFFEDDKMGEAGKRLKCSEDGDVAKMNKVAVEKKKKKTKKSEKVGGESDGKEAGVEPIKDKREKVGGEFRQNVITDGKEAQVETGKKKKKERGEKVGGKLPQNAVTDEKEAGVKTVKKKKERGENVGGELPQNAVTDGKRAGAETGKKKKEKREKAGSELVQNTDDGNKKQRVKSDDGGQLPQKAVTDGKEAGVETRKTKKKEKREKVGSEFVQNADDRNKKKKRVKSGKHVSEEDSSKHRKKKGKLEERSLRSTKNDTGSKTSKRVSFADDVKVVYPNDESGHMETESLEDPGETGIIHGKRYSKEEDSLLEEAVLAYVEEHGLGEKGISMVLNCKSNPETRNCWNDINATLPWRSHKSIYHRAHLLFERSETRSWTPEEYKFVERAGREFKAKGKKPDWRKVADELGKHRVHIKDAYRRIKSPNFKKGKWSQEEYQTLFDLVNKDLQMRVFEEKKSKHGMLRDNIKWEAISETLGTRSDPVCCQKWYDQLTSPLVAEKVWADIDDYRLIYALDSLDASCIEDVDWDDLLEHRSGDVCRKRWKEMVKHIGHHRIKSFREQVEIMSKRFCPDALEAREIFDSKPFVN